MMKTEGVSEGEAVDAILKGYIVSNHVNDFFKRDDEKGILIFNKYNSTWGSCSWQWFISSESFHIKQPEPEFEPVKGEVTIVTEPVKFKAVVSDVERLQNFDEGQEVYIVPPSYVENRGPSFEEVFNVIDGMPQANMDPIVDLIPRHETEQIIKKLFKEYGHEVE